jgi:hypothetical protein
MSLLTQASTLDRASSLLAKASQKVLFPLTLSLSKGSDLKMPKNSDRFDKLNVSGFKFTTFLTPPQRRGNQSGLSLASLVAESTRWQALQRFPHASHFAVGIIHQFAFAADQHRGT